MRSILPACLTLLVVVGISSAAPRPSLDKSPPGAAATVSERSAATTKVPGAAVGRSVAKSSSYEITAKLGLAAGSQGVRAEAQHSHQDGWQRRRAHACCLWRRGATEH